MKKQLITYTAGEDEFDEEMNNDRVRDDYEKKQFASTQQKSVAPDRKIKSLEDNWEKARTPKAIENAVKAVYTIRDKFKLTAEQERRVKALENEIREHFK